MSPEQVIDVLDCGNAQENWQTVVMYWRDRARMSRGNARQLSADAIDANERAAEHAEDARNFEALANALESANVTFPTTDTISTRDGVRANNAPPVNNGD